MSDVEKLERLLEDARQVRDSNLRVAQFAMDRYNEQADRAKFFEVTAGELHTGFSKLLLALMEADPRLYGNLTKPIEDYLPDQFPVYRSLK
jgi:hypothetical protein